MWIGRIPFSLRNSSREGGQFLHLKTRVAGRYDGSCRKPSSTLGSLEISEPRASEIRANVDQQTSTPGRKAG